MAGIFAIVGPSGVGKDTVIDAVCAATPDVVRIRRSITRASDAGGEDFAGVSEAEFDAAVSRGDFILHWQAHGMRYGVPRRMLDLATRGKAVLFNGSRAMLADAVRVLPQLRVIHLTARPDILAQRLADRGREPPDEIAKRLARADLALPLGLDVVEIDNSGPLETAVSAFLNAVQPVRA